DVKGVYTVQFPKTWKTSLYSDEIQSSIYTADTTKQLTASILLDVNLINKKNTFNDVFKLKIEQENLSKNQIQKTSKEITFLGKPSYYTLSFGKQKEHPFQKLQLFIHLNTNNYLIATAKIFGDTLVDKRTCTAISLLKKIKLL
ncbi:MAG: hypothetical protein ACWIPJ_11415, partial [Polaribacter sp.]